MYNLFQCAVIASLILGLTLATIWKFLYSPFGGFIKITLRVSPSDTRLSRKGFWSLSFLVKLEIPSVVTCVGFHCVPVTPVIDIDGRGSCSGCTTCPVSSIWICV